MVLGYYKRAMETWMASKFGKPTETKEGDNRYYYKRMKAILEAFPNKGPPFTPTRLCDHVYIGTQRNADDVALLQRLGITHVLNMAGTRRFDVKRSPYPKNSGIRDFLMIQAEDHDEYDIMQDFPKALDFLDEVKAQQGRALVHCNLGINRSGTIVAAHLLECTRKPLLEIISYLKLKRSVILCNRNFRNIIIKYARAKQLLDNVLDEDSDPVQLYTERDPQMTLLEKTKQAAKSNRAWEQNLQSYDKSLFISEGIGKYRPRLENTYPRNGRTENGTASPNSFQFPAPSSARQNQRNRRPVSWGFENNSDDDDTWPRPNIVSSGLDDLNLDRTPRRGSYSNGLHTSTIAIHVPKQRNYSDSRFYSMKGSDSLGSQSYNTIYEGAGFSSNGTQRSRAVQRPSNTYGSLERISSYSSPRSSQHFSSTLNRSRSSNSQFRNGSQYGSDLCNGLSSLDFDDDTYGVRARTLPRSHGQPRSYPTQTFRSKRTSIYSSDNNSIDEDLDLYRSNVSDRFNGPLYI